MQRVPELAGRELPSPPCRAGSRTAISWSWPSGVADRHVIRLAGNDTHLLGITREVEHAATVAAAGVGVGPEVIAVRPARGLSASPGSSWASRCSRRGRPPGRPRSRRVADSIRRVHDGPAIPGLFIPLRIVEAYRALAVARGVPIPPEYDLAPWRSPAGSSSPSWPNPLELRPCHNDLLNANFIDDGERIRIVDWEYAGLGDPFFDLGNFSVNHDLSPDEDAVLLAAYEGTVRPSRAGAAHA